MDEAWKIIGAVLLVIGSVGGIYSMWDNKRALLMKEYGVSYVMRSEFWKVAWFMSLSGGAVCFLIAWALRGYV